MAASGRMQPFTTHIPCKAISASSLAAYTFRHLHNAARLISKISHACRWSSLTNFSTSRTRWCSVWWRIFLMAVGRQRQAPPAPVGRHILEALSTAAPHPPRPAYRTHGFAMPTPIRPGFPVRARCRAKRGLGALQYGGWQGVNGGEFFAAPLGIEKGLQRQI